MKIIFNKYGGLKTIEDRQLLVQSSSNANYVDIYYQDENGNFADPDINLATIAFKRADTFEISERTCALVKEELTNNPLYFRYILKEDELAINGELQMTVRLKQVVFDPEDDSKVLLIKQRAMGKITAHIYEAIGGNYENFDVVDGRILQLELWQANFESDYYNADQIDAKLVLERQATNDAIDEHNTNTEATHLDIRQSIENLDNTLQEQIDTINGTLSEHDFRINELEDFASNLETDITEEIEQALSGKADLVDGKVPLEQLPPIDNEITKEEIEAVLTGDITSHNHATEIGNHNSSGTSHSDIRTAINNLQSAITTIQNIIGTVGEDDENEVIDKLQEVFKVLEDFEEDSNLVSILANKVDIDDLPIVIGYLSSGVFYKDSGLTQAITGSTSKIYIDIKESNKKIYWFNGTVYEEISKPLSLGTGSNQAFYGDLGQTAYEHSQSTHAPSNAQKNVQSDWNQTDNTKDDYIKNKPTIPTIPDITVNNGSAESGKYISAIAVDSTNKHKLNITKADLPTIPTLSHDITTDIADTTKAVTPNAVGNYTYSRSAIDAMIGDIETLLGGI